MSQMKEETWLDRLKVEHAQVKERFDKLDNFILGETFSGLPAVERTDLCEQWRHMDGYVQVLERRLARATREVGNG